MKISLDKNNELKVAILLDIESNKENCIEISHNIIGTTSVAAAIGLSKV